MEFLAQEYPQALEERNNDNYTPLHIACKAQAPMQVIEMLVDKYPGAVLLFSRYTTSLGLLL